LKDIDSDVVIVPQINCEEENEPISEETNSSKESYSVAVPESYA
jgi:hypothetical protein